MSHHKINLFRHTLAAAKDGISQVATSTLPILQDLTTDVQQQQQQQPASSVILPEDASQISRRPLHGHQRNAHPLSSFPLMPSGPALLNHSRHGPLPVTQPPPPTRLSAKPPMTLSTSLMLEAAAADAFNAQQSSRYRPLGAWSAGKNAQPTRELLASFLLPATSALKDLPPGLLHMPKASSRSHSNSSGDLAKDTHASSRKAAAGDAKGQARKKLRGSSSSVQLNKDIMATRNVAELLELVRSKGHLFDFFNISSAISRTPKLVEAATGHTDQTPLDPDHELPLPATNGPGSPDHSHTHTQLHHLSPAAHELADRLASLMCDNIHAFDARGLANSAWAFGKLRYVPSSNLPTMICAAATQKIKDFGPQNLSNLAWAFVYMHHRDERLLSLMADRVRSMVSEFKPQELANLMWAFASLEHYDRDMVQAVAARALTLAPLFKEQELSNIIWALGRLRHSDPQLMNALLKETKAKLRHFLPQGVSNVAWALGQLGHRDEELMRLIVKQCMPQLPQFDAQALSNLAWGMATVGFKHEPFFTALIDQCLDRIDRMSPQNLSNVIWSCATLNHQDPKMLAVWSQQTMEKLPLFEPQGISNTAWSFAKLNYHQPELFQLLGAAALSKLDRFNSQGLSNTAWAFATAQMYHPELFDQLARKVVRAAGSFNAQNCSMTLWAFSNVRHYNQEMFDTVMRRLASDVASCEPQNVANALLACAHMAHEPSQAGAPLASAALAMMGRMNQQELCNSAWAMASMGMLDTAGFEHFCSCLQRVKGITHEGMHQAFHTQLMLHSSLVRQAGVPFLALDPEQLPQLPQPLLAAAQALWLSSVGDVRVSRLQQQVSAALSAAGAANELEWLTKDGLFSIDIAMEVNNQPVAVEVYGAHHCSANMTLRPTGDVAVRRKLLEDRGWQVVNVGYSDWEALGDTLHERGARLLQLVALQLGSPSWLSVKKPQDSSQPASPSQVSTGGTLQLPSTLEDVTFGGLPVSGFLNMLGMSVADIMAGLTSSSVQFPLPAEQAAISAIPSSPQASLWSSIWPTSAEGSGDALQEAAAAASWGVPSLAALNTGLLSPDAALVDACEGESLCNTPTARSCLPSELRDLLGMQEGEGEGEGVLARRDDAVLRLPDALF